MSASRRKRPKAAARRRPAQRRRYGQPMPTREKVLLAVLWVVVQVAGFFLLPEWTQRIGLAALTLFALPLVVTLWLSPRSSR